MKDYDFCGWATKNDILCDDGRIIRNGAFKEQDGVQVPLVYNHDHKDIDNVLGHCVLENRDDGVYCYGYIDKNSKNGPQALSLLKNGSMKSLSIFANKLKQVGRDVMHGVIREVSLVIGGANSGATIDAVLAHGADASDEDAVIIYAGDENPIWHDGLDEDDEMSHTSEDDFDEEAIFDTMTDDQKRLMLIMMGRAAEDAANSNVAHSALEEELVNNEEESNDDDNSDDNDSDDDKTESNETDEEKHEDNCSHGFSLFGNDDELSHNSEEENQNENDSDNDDDDSNDDDEDDDDNSDDDDDNDIEHSFETNNTNNITEEENKEMARQNMFEANDNNVINHSIDSKEACKSILDDAQKFGSLKDSCMAHSADYGIDNIDMLFPNAKNYTTQPGFIKRRTEWVNTVLGGVRQSPFSRVKTIFADITEDEARAKGYIKGNRKAEEVFTLLKRETTPTTVYKKQRIDRDDVLDITEFSVIEYIKEEMRIMFDEECARAILVGDGRNALSPDKIKEQNIRPIWTDDELFTIKRSIAVTTATTDEARAKAFIKNVVKSRKLYRGSGNPTLFIQEDLLSDMLLIEDSTGRLIYDTLDKLKNALRVDKIVEVPVFAGLSRVDNGDTKFLAAILVNLNDYRTGRDKGGELSFFDDFDIDFNQMKYLMESRFSGALVVPFSAIVYEFVYNLTLEVEAKDNSATILGKAVSELQENVYVNDTSIQGVLNYVTGFTAFSDNPDEQEGHYLALQFEASEGATVKIQTIGGLTDEEKVLDSDMDAVIYVKSNKMKLRVTCTLNGDTVTKTLSFGGLKLLQ